MSLSNIFAFPSLQLLPNQCFPRTVLEKQEPHSIAPKGVKVIGPTPDNSSVKVTRPVWYFLTLGIPILIETLSLFFDGVIHREKTGDAVRFRFKYKYLPTSRVNQVTRFQQYNEIAYSILNGGELKKALQLMEKSKGEYEKALEDGDSDQAKISQEKFNSLIALLEKNKNEKLSRKDMTDKDWKELDLIDYEVAKDYFSELAEVFNSTWFKNLEFGKEMTERFRVDYHEAAVAESLSLSLAYIEGLDGKIFSLPVFDKETNSYRSVEYKIKEAHLGDALPCYIFESEDPQASPWFVVRGTQYNKDRAGSFESIVADAIDHKCIARHIINKALVHRPLVKEGDVFVQKDSLSDIFERWRKQNKQVILAGHSLGGTLVNNLAVDFPDTIKAVYAFCAAGVSRVTGERWKQLPQSSQDKIINFDFEGDVVPSGGHCLIGRHLAIQALLGAEQPNGVYLSHVRSHLNRDFQIQKVDILKENTKFARVFCEKIRVIAGHCLRFLLSIFGNKYLPDWWKNRSIYKLQAKMQRTILSKLRAMPIAE